jgi:hypothetical protein
LCKLGFAMIGKAFFSWGSILPYIMLLKMGKTFSFVCVCVKVWFLHITCCQKLQWQVFLKLV